MPVIYNYDAIKSIMNDSGEDISSFAIASVEHYNQALLLDQDITMSLERMNSNITLINKVCKTYGIEAHSDLIGETSKELIGGFFNILSKIIAFFKHIALVITNFVKSILNFFGSLAFKKQSNFYEKYKNEFGSKLVHLKHTDLNIICQLPKNENSLKFFLDTFPKSLNKLVDSTKTFKKYYDILESGYNDLQANKNINLSTKIKSYFTNVDGGIILIGNKTHSAIGELTKAVKFDGQYNTIGGPVFGRIGTPAYGNTATNLLGLGTKSPSQFIRTLLYVDNKTKRERKRIPIALDKFFKHVPFEYLSSSTASKIKEYVRSGKIIINELNDQIKSTKNMLKKVEKLGGRLDINSGSKKFINKFVQISDISRGLHVFVSGMLICTYSEFIKLRGYCYRAAVMVIDSK